MQGGTATAESAGDGRGATRGAQMAFLPKPFTAAALMAAVERALAVEAE